MNMSEQQIARAEGVLRQLASRMLSDFPRVRRWDETDDVLQESSIRLYRALSTTPIVSDLHFYRLATLQIRRVLIDLARRYAAESHFAANHDTTVDGGESRIQTAVQSMQTALSLDDWTEFHLAVERLPPDQREIIDLLWYSGLSQDEAAQLLGITVRTVQRRWREARLMLHERLASEPMSNSPRIWEDFE